MNTFIVTFQRFFLTLEISYIFAKHLFYRLTLDGSFFLYNEAISLIVENWLQEAISYFFSKIGVSFSRTNSPMYCQNYELYALSVPKGHVSKALPFFLKIEQFPFLDKVDINLRLYNEYCKISPTKGFKKS